MANFRTNFLLLLCLSLLLVGCSTSEDALHPLESHAVILAFGDSLTYGTGVSVDDSYPAVLGRASGLHVINDGVPGETSAQGLARLKDSLEEYQPQLIIICYGGNDILQNLSLDKTQTNIEKMIKMSKAFGADVVLVSVPKKALFLQSLPLYKILAENYKIPLEDKILSELLADKAMKSDSVHFNVAGYRAFAKALQQLLQSKGALPK